MTRGFSLFFLFFEVGGGVVVVVVPQRDGVDELRIARVPRFHERQVGVSLFDKALRLGQNHDVVMISQFFKDAHRGWNRSSRRRACGARPPKRCATPAASTPTRETTAIPCRSRRALVINRPSGFNVGADDEKFHRVFLIGFAVKRVEGVGNVVITKPFAVEIAGPSKGNESSHNAGRCKNADCSGSRGRAAWICSCSQTPPRRTHRWRRQTPRLFQQHIRHPAGEHAAHCAAFQYQTVFHWTSFFPSSSQKR